MKNKRKVLVTGGAGYIGSHTIIELIENGGWEVISADNYSNSSVKTFERIMAITGKRIKNYAINLCDVNSTKRIFRENPAIEGIIHFAAFKSVPESVEKPLLYYHNNIVSLLNILTCCKEYGISNFIFSSSCSVYGDIKKLPVNENTPLNKAMSPYGFTKQIGEEVINGFTDVNKNIHAISLRYFNPVGAHPSALIGEVPIQQPNNLVPIITRTAAGLQKQMTVYGNTYKTRDGTCIRDYVHVCDIASAHVKALHSAGVLNGNMVFNLGTGKGVSVLEMIKAFEKVSGKKLNYRIGKKRAGDIPAIFSDSRKAEKVLKWKPKFNLNDMMSTAWEWERNQKFH